MRRLTLVLICGFVFSLPSEFLIVLGPFGTLSRLLGLLAALSGLITVVVEGRVRRPGIVVVLALGFIVASAMSLMWTNAPASAVDRVSTYLQLFGLVWLIWEFVRRREHYMAVMASYCLGSYVPAADVLRSFIAGVPVMDNLRYASGAFDPNDLGLTLALAIPMAWFLFLTRRGLLRVAGVAYLPLAVGAILLTASRGAFIATAVALCVIPLTFPWRSPKLSVVALGAMALSGLAITQVPDAIWDRLMTAPQEITSGTLGGRWGIWSAGLRAFAENPLLGAGAGAFEVAVEPIIGRAASHNALIAVLVEQGSLGLGILLALLISLGWFIRGLHGAERHVWMVVGLTWLVGVMSLNWQYRKVTWFLIALLAAGAALSRVRERAAPVRSRAGQAAGPRRAGPRAYVPGRAGISY